jgi:serine/threonine-protein kinase HipA
MGGLLPLFEMNLPEGALRERLRNQFAKAIPEFDDLDLLAVVGSSQIGRLQYSTAEDLADPVPEQDLDEILTYNGTADLFAAPAGAFCDLFRYFGTAAQSAAPSERGPGENGAPRRHPHRQDL